MFFKKQFKPIKHLKYLFYFCKIMYNLKINEIYLVYRFLGLNNSDSISKIFFAAHMSRFEFPFDGDIQKAADAGDQQNVLDIKEKLNSILNVTDIGDLQKALDEKDYVFARLLEEWYIIHDDNRGEEIIKKWLNEKNVEDIGDLLTALSKHNYLLIRLLEKWYKVNDKEDEKTEIIDSWLTSTDKKNLPFKGVLHEAMIRRNFIAINLINRWSKLQVKKEKKEVYDFGCSNIVDYITQKKWKKEPDIKLEFIDPGKKSYTLCFKLRTLKEWMRNKENYFAHWIQNPAASVSMTNTGVCGMPNEEQIYLKLPDGTTFIENSLLNIKDPIGVKVESNVRIGNLRGSLGVSNLHGQLPGYSVYRIISRGDDSEKKLTKTTEFSKIFKQHNSLEQELSKAIKDKDKDKIKDVFGKIIFNIDIDIDLLNKLIEFSIEDEKFFKELGLDPSEQNNEAIIWASEYGRVKVVELLLKDKRVDPSAQDNKAIIWASLRGHVQVVKLLLKDPRVDPSAKNNRAIKLASGNGHVDVVELLLKDKRVDPSAQIQKRVWPKKR